MSLPGVIGVIPDGNRRWAKENRKTNEEAYRAGADVFLELLGWCLELGIKHVVAYASSADNVAKRETSEVRAIHYGVTHFLDQVASEYPRDVAVHLFGDIDGIPADRGGEKLRAHARRQQPAQPKLCFYGGANYDDMAHLLWDGKGERPRFQSEGVPQINLLIRPGRWKRLSKFCPVQCADAQFRPLPSLWPDFNRRRFQEALRWHDRQLQNHGE